MALIHLALDGSETGLTSAIKINNGFSQSDINLDRIVTLEGTVGTNSTNISTNATNIGTNTTNISTNTSNIEMNIDRINNLTADYQKSGSILGVPDTYTEIISLPNTRGEAVYMIHFSGSYTYDSIVTSAYFRFSLNNGADWVEFKKEPSDITDIVTFNYSFPETLTETAVIKVEVRADSATDTFNISSFNATLIQLINAVEVPYTA